MDNTLTYVRLRYKKVGAAESEIFEDYFNIEQLYVLKKTFFGGNIRFIKLRTIVWAFDFDWGELSQECDELKIESIVFPDSLYSLINGYIDEIDLSNDNIDIQDEVFKIPKGVKEFNGNGNHFSSLKIMGGIKRLRLKNVPELTHLNLPYAVNHLRCDDHIVINNMDKLVANTTLTTFTVENYGYYSLQFSRYGTKNGILRLNKTIKSSDKTWGECETFTCKEFFEKESIKTIFNHASHFDRIDINHEDDFNEIYELVSYLKEFNVGFEAINFNTLCVNGMKQKEIKIPEYIHDFKCRSGGLKKVETHNRLYILDLVDNELESLILPEHSWVLVDCRNNDTLKELTIPEKALKGVTLARLYCDRGVHITNLESIVGQMDEDENRLLVKME